MRIDIVTIFPEMVTPYFDATLFKRARKYGLIELFAHNLRDYTKHRSKKVDDKPVGGGPGMVLAVEPIRDAVRAIQRQSRAVKKRVILFSTRGKTFTSRDARRLAAYGQIILICGRYEGVDERVAKYIADEEISIGDFVLSGGEPAAIVVADAVGRHIPGFLGSRESLEEIKGSYPVYARPVSVDIDKKIRKVPPVLLSGNHAKITAWRKRRG